MNLPRHIKEHAALDVLAASDIVKTQGRRIAIVGDSITEFCTSGTGASLTSIGIWGNGFYYWWMRALNWACFLDINAGDGGATTTEILANFQTNVLDRDNDIVHILAGVNNLTTAITKETTWADIKSMADQAIAKGRLVILGTFWPNDSVAYTDAQLEKCFYVNNEIRNYGRTVQGAVFVDYYKLVIEPSSVTVTALLRAGYTDNVHPKVLFAKIMGEAVAAVTVGLFTNGVDLTSSKIDTFNENAGSLQLIDNPVMTDTPYSNPPAGDIAIATGDLAVGLSLNDQVNTGITNVTCSIVAHPDGLGLMQQISITGNAGDSIWIQGQNVGGDMLASDTFWAEMYAEADVGGASGYMPKIALRLFAAFTTAGNKNLYCMNEQHPIDWPKENFKGILRTPPYGIEGDTATTLLMRFELTLPEAGTYVLRLGNDAIYKNRPGVWSGDVGIGHINYGA